MKLHHAHAEPPIDLAGRVRQLNETLLALAVRLKDAIAGAVARAVAQAVRDGVNELLGNDRHLPDPEEPDDRFRERGWPDLGDDPWAEDEPRRAVVAPERPENDRWKQAARAAVQAALWWIRQQPRRRPLLTTTLVAVAAGGAALVAGPSFAACVSVIASVASLLLTADAARSAAGLFGLAA